MKWFILFLPLVLCLSLVSAGDTIKNFDTNDYLVSSVIESGRTSFKNINFFNSGKSREFDISSSGNDIFDLKTESLFVEGDSFGTFSFNFKGDLLPGFYFSKIIIDDGEDFIEIPILLGVESKNKIFGDSISLSQNSLNLFPGGELDSKISLFNLGSLQSAVSVNYGLFDLEGNLLVSETEVLDVERNLEISKSIKLPTDLTEGKKVLVVSISQGESYGVSYEFFDIVQINLSPDSGSFLSSWIFYFLVFVLVLALLITSHYWNRRVISEAKDWRGKIGALRKYKFSDNARYLRKLSRQKSLLESAYSDGYVSQDSYSKGIKEINKLIDNTKDKL